jgi:hypothetical protein
LTLNTVASGIFEGDRGERGGELLKLESYASEHSIPRSGTYTNVNIVSF